MMQTVNACYDASSTGNEQMQTNIDTTLRGMKVNVIVDLSEETIISVRTLKGKDANWLRMTDDDEERIIEEAREDYFG
jgi:hypothetical protein